MIRAYRRGLTLEETGQMFGGISKERVRQIFERAGFKRRKKTLSDKFIKSRQAINAKRQLPLPRRELEKMYGEQKQSAKQIADFFNCHASTVRRHLIQYGIPMRSYDEVHQMRRKCPEFTERVLREKYITKNKTAAEIAAEYKCSRGTITKSLKKFGIKKHPA